MLKWFKKNTANPATDVTAHEEVPTVEAEALGTHVQSMPEAIAEGRQTTVLEPGVELSSPPRNLSSRPIFSPDMNLTLPRTEETSFSPPVEATIEIVISPESVQPDFMDDISFPDIEGTPIPPTPSPEPSTADRPNMPADAPEEAPVLLSLNEENIATEIIPPTIDTPAPEILFEKPPEEPIADGSVEITLAPDVLAAESSATPALPPEEPTAPKAASSWLGRLREGLSKSSASLSDGIAGIFTKRKLDAQTLEELEEVLIMADMGVSAAAKIVGEFGKTALNRDITPEEIKSELARHISAMLAPCAHPLTIRPDHTPHVVLVVGVNGNGKTTTMGKLAQRFRQEGKTVMMAAADTFRAAAAEQLEVWGKRADVEVIRAEKDGADAASVAYRALEQATAQQTDVLMIDTAGRLHNKKNLMDELQKIIRVIQKIDASAPHSVIQVLDGTTGQNALSQVKTFKELIQVNGMIITKLDGTAKGGVVVALAEQFGLPIHAVGVGEAIDDLQPFTAEEFVRSLVGLENDDGKA